MYKRQLTVIKSGKGQTGATARLEVSEAALEAYNTANGTDYKALPANYVTFSPAIKFSEKDIRKTVMMPGNAKLRHIEIEKRNKELAEAANTLPINRVEMNDTKIGVITSGIPYQYVKEALPNASVCKLGLVNPLPRKMIEDFASKVDKLYIVEELDPVIEEQVKSWGIECVGKDIFTVQGLSLIHI